MSTRGINYAALFTLRPDGRYQGYWHDLDREGQPTGKRHTICDRDPEKLFRRIQEKETPGRRTLKDLAEQWEGVHREEITDRTWMNYKPHYEDIMALHGDRPLTDFSAFDVTQDLLAAKAAGYSRTVVSTRRSIWNGIFDYAVAMRELPYNPAASVKLPKGLKVGKRDAPDQATVAAIVAGAEDMDFGFIPFFLLCTGLRRNEALQRLVSDLDTQRWELHIPRAKTEAGVRTVPIIEPLRPLLQRWIQAHPGPWLFPYVPYNGRAGKYMTDSNWERAWTQYCAAHGWVDPEGKPTFTAHALRHGTATLLYEAGVDVYTMQRILGHASVSTTMEIYAELRAEHEKKNVAKFGRSIKKLIAKSKKPAE